METKSYDFFDTRLKQRVLNFFKENENEKLSTLDLSKKLDEPQSSLNRVLNELEEASILISEYEGKFKYFRINKKIADIMDSVFSYLEKARIYTLEQRKKKEEEK